MKNLPTVLITGASSGFGHHFAKLFAQDGYNLVLVARREPLLKEIAEELNTTYGAAVKILPKDLFVPSAPQEIYDTLKQENIVVDVLVNNAGFGNYGKFATNAVEDELNLVQLNVNALTYMTRLFVADMVDRRAGAIINVASMAAFAPGPYLASYCASKAYVLYLTEAIAEEVSSFGVKMMALCPGASPTGFQTVAKNEHSLIGGRVNALMAPAEEIINEAYADFKAGKTISIPGRGNRIGQKMIRVIPRAWIRKGGKKLMYTKELGEQ